MPTPHIQSQKGDFAKTVLMPGDPLRAKFIAETFLTDYKKINDVRGMTAYTGKFEGREISVMPSGMGMPSMAIYAHELYTEYEVENIIRLGSCGGYSEKVKLRDVIIAMSASTTSNFQSQFNLTGHFAPSASFDLLIKAKVVADELGIASHVGSILTSDIFYNADAQEWKKWAKLSILAVEMETAALYMTAAKLNKKALSILTVSDHFCSNESTTSEEREKTFTDMMQIALRIN